MKYYIPQPTQLLNLHARERKQRVEGQAAAEKKRENEKRKSPAHTVIVFTLNRQFSCSDSYPPTRVALVR